MADDTSDFSEPDNVDDLMEETRDDPLNAQVGDVPLDEDNDTPASDADTLDGDPEGDDTHPSTDTDVDETERYNEGL